MGHSAKIDLDARRASFLSPNDDYERGRPGYPVDAIVWVVGDEPKQILDLGCGPGNLTSQLAQLGHSVVGIDASKSMLRGMTAKGLEAVCGTAEAIPLGADTADVVTAAQAFHWFDHERALPEIWRVLKPGGNIGLLWNLRDERADWVQDLSRIIGSEDAMGATIGDAERFGDDPARGALLASPLFGEIEHRVFEFGQDLTPERFMALVRSRSYVAVLPEKQRRAVLEAVEKLWSEHPDLAGRDKFVMPYKTHAFRIEVVP
ncbi:MAG: class I SAM-dependent methyltransferase [Actinomycetota bacterium]